MGHPLQSQQVVSTSVYHKRKVGLAALKTVAQDEAVAGLVLHQHNSLAPGDSSETTAQSPVITSNLLSRPMNQMELNCMDEPWQP